MKEQYVVWTSWGDGSWKREAIETTKEEALEAYLKALRASDPEDVMLTKVVTVSIE